MLLILALLATTFPTLQPTERNVSRNYLDTVRARLRTINRTQALRSWREHERKYTAHRKLALS